ncbi:hypothetical protein ACFYP6_37575 [Streptomyces goshikiensis]|uniref:hypothetical protein n=1 Tax=Streptomyces goshikiensis TaxID=1942 RepID=UPI003676ACC3
MPTLAGADSGTQTEEVEKAGSTSMDVVCLSRGVIVERSPEEAWDEMLEAGRPPHENDWDEAFWPLLEAASRNELFRSMHPWRSLNQFYPSEFDDMRNRHELFPSIAAAPGLYSVMAHPVTSGIILLKTQDPAESVSFAADQIFRIMSEMENH